MTVQILDNAYPVHKFVRADMPVRGITDLHTLKDKLTRIELVKLLRVINQGLSLKDAVEIVDMLILEKIHQSPLDNDSLGD